MSRNKKYSAIIFAILAAALYAVSTPVSKVLLQSVSPTMVAAFLYLGAGVGLGVLILGRKLNNAGFGIRDLTIFANHYKLGLPRQLKDLIFAV